MCTSRPSNRISPLSAACVPAMHLISVDLPAPLSPTSAITSPARTSKSTSLSASTEPNVLVMPRSSRSGCSVNVGISDRGGGAPIGGRLHRSLGRLAVLLELADADVALLDELVRVETVDVRLRDPDHGQGNRRQVLAAVLPDRVRLHLLALDEGNRGSGDGCCLG